MKYSEAYQTLTQLRDGSIDVLPGENARYLAQVSLVHLMTAEEHNRFQELDERSWSLENQLKELKDENFSLQAQKWKLDYKHNSWWHRLWSKRRNLRDEENQIAEMNSSYIKQRERIDESQHRLDDLRQECKRYSTEVPPEFTRAFTQFDRDGYIRLTKKGLTLLERLGRLLLKDNSEFEFDPEIAFSSNYDRFTNRYAKDAFNTNHDDSIVPLIPDLIRLAYQCDTVGCAHIIEDFFATLAYPSAIHHLIQALGSEVVRVKEIEKKEIQTTTWCEDFEDGGTFGSGEGVKEITVETFEVKYRLGSSVGEGAKKALIQLLEIHPEVREQIEPAIKEYNARLEQIETKQETERHEKTVSYRNTGIYRQ